MIKNGQVKFGHDPAKLWQITQLAFDLLERVGAHAAGTAERPKLSQYNKLSAEEVAVCREIFSIFDADGNDIFGEEEFRAALSHPGRPHDSIQVKRAMACITGAEDTFSLTFEQFSSLLQVAVSSSSIKAGRERFPLRS
jgi:Ca2+-binding EF-hand superfamily protein